MRFSIYRYHPEIDNKPYMQDYAISVTAGMMLLDALLQIKAQDETLTFRRSCQEGVCGSDGVNVNGVNRLACITDISELKEPIIIRPLPGHPIIRDLVVDLSRFYRQYEAVKPYLIVHDAEPDIEYLQTPAQRDQLDGLYECILCACCSSACPSFWWNPERFRGPAALLQAYRFLADSRDQAQTERLLDLTDAYALFRCHTIMNCVEVCPKGLNPSRAISKIRTMMLNDTI